MAANTAEQAYGITMTIAGVNIADIVSIETEMSRDSIDVSHLASTNLIREFIPGAVDPGTITLGLSFTAEDTGGQQDLWEAIMGAAGGAPTEKSSNKAYVITWPDIAGTGGETWTVNGHVQSFSTSAPDLSSKIDATVVIKCAGQITITTATA